MMDTRKLTTVLAMALLVFALIALAVPVAGRPSDNIIVNGADVIRQESVASSQGLTDSTVNVGPRIIVQYANTLRAVYLSAVPGAFQTLLGLVSDRIVFEHANTNRQLDLAAVPAAFQTLLSRVTDRIIFEHANTNRQFDLASVPGNFRTLLAQVTDRIIFQYANTHRSLSLVYPRTLVNDTTLPQISNVKAEAMGNDTASITWATDEFADSQVSYGVQSGQYTGTASDPLYVKQHVITLTAIISGTTYYYQVRSTDQSNNRSTSSENSFKFQPDFHVFLPVVLKQS